MSQPQTIGDYVYDKFLGQGSFGKVYKGYHKVTKEVVAIKCMDMANIQDPYMINSLKTEIHVMKALKSQNVVRMFDVIYEPKTTYIILELCPDGDLDKFIQNHGGMLDEKTAIEVLRQLIEGFKELVSLNYIHRDIKPANSLVKDGIHKVADFGFACEADIKGKNLIKECVGTPLFMAPQLLDNKPYTAKSDIWSIGMMFYMMIFGSTPWPCRDLRSFLTNIKTQPLRFPYNKPIGPATKDFITRALVVDEAKRIGWEEFFKHPIFSNQNNAPVQTTNLDPKAVSILKKMQEIVRNNNLNIKDIFSNFDKSKSGDLEQEEFYKLIQVIDPRVTYSESTHIFKQVDKSGDGKISYQEFAEIFNNYDFNDVQDIAGRIIIDLKEIIKAHNLNVKDIFANFDKDKSNDLDQKEFGQLLRIIAPGLKDYEIEKCFKRFDADGSGKVSFQEFYRVLVNGIPGQDSKQDLNKEKQDRILSELKRIINQYKLSLKDIFKNFDKSGDGKLDSNEFYKLLQAIDKSVHQSDASSLFKRFDKEGGGDISFNEFYAELN